MGSRNDGVVREVGTVYWLDGSVYDIGCFMTWICWTIICLRMRLSGNLSLLVMLVLLDTSWPANVGPLSVLE